MNLLVFQIISSAIILVSSQEDGKRLIKTNGDDPGQWMTVEEILELKKINKGFFDITDFNYPDIEPLTARSEAIPSALKYTETVQGLFPSDEVSWLSRMEGFLQEFSSFTSRFCLSDAGREPQLWLLSQVTELVKSYGGKVEVFEVDHKIPQFTQQSVVCRIEGEDETLNREVVILGAHLDSVNYEDPYGPAPGADDNGSGVIAILEVLQAIVDHSVRFQRTLEFHWYAAEEVGLQGSQSLADDYRGKNVNVVGMLNLDVVGYPTPDMKEVAIFTDFTNADLNQLLRLLTEAHLSYGWKDKECGYACSDHGSWTKNGYPAAFASEPEFTPVLHSFADELSTVDFEQVKQFVKLSIGFAVELAEPMAAE